MTNKEAYLFLFLSTTLSLNFHEASAQINFGSPQSLSTTVDGVRDVFIADLDHDGDNDILAAGFFDDDVFWFENTDGAGNFGGKVQVSLSGSLNGCWTVRAADLNGDGFIDVVAGAYTDDKAVYYPGDGTGAFGSEQLIATNLNGLKDLDYGDFDGDGDLDVVTANTLGDNFSYIENLGSGTFAAPVDLPSGIYWFDGARSVRVIDFDRDGDQDIVSCSALSHVIGWHSNDGEGNFADFQFLTQEIFEPQCIDVGDFDGDDDYDITSAVLFGNKIAAHYNPGEEIAWTDVDLNDGMTYALWVRLGDLDRDADLDIVGCGRFSDTVSLFENDGSGTFGTEQLITDALDSPEAFAIGDLDGDLYPDIAVVNFGNDQVSWIKNLSPAPCLAPDFNDDQTVNIADLLLFLGEIGCTEVCGRYDLNGDQSVNSGDLLVFLSVFGDDC
jgi:hypothetical protein